MKQKRRPNLGSNLFRNRLTVGIPEFFGNLARLEPRMHVFVHQEIGLLVGHEPVQMHNVVMPDVPGVWISIKNP
jgi:hypothetical protein